jgi:signal transduction histidine kinase
VIDQSANNIYKLLENLLQWSRSQTGNIKFDPEKFTIEEVVRANISLLNNQLEEKKIKTIIDIPKGLQVYADKNMINTVIRNLINNAIKYTEEGEIFIGAEKNNKSVTVSVKDSGVGMNEELTIAF